MTLFADLEIIGTTTEGKNATIIRACCDCKARLHSVSAEEWRTPYHTVRLGEQQASITSMKLITNSVRGYATLMCGTASVCLDPMKKIVAPVGSAVRGNIKMPISQHGSLGSDAFRYEE